MIETNLDYFKSVRDSIQADGFEIGLVKPHERETPGLALRFFIIFAISSGFLILLSWGWKIRSYILAVLILLISIYVATQNPELLPVKLWGILAGITFPVLGLAYIFNKWEIRGKFHNYAVAFAIVILFTISGAILVAALFSTSAYMLEMHSYSGVKLSFVIPVFLAALLGVRLYFRKNKSDFFRELAFLGDFEIKVKHLAFLAVLAFAGLIILTRSGNEPIFAVSQMENTLRGALEEFFSVRPRTKEFLIGHPLMILALYTLCRYPVKLDSLAFICIVGGMIGQVSMFNTFCHFHTPLSISLTRTIYGLAAGIIGGLILIFVLSIILRLAAKSTQN